MEKTSELPEAMERLKASFENYGVTGSDAAEALKDFGSKMNDWANWSATLQVLRGIDRHD